MLFPNFHHYFNNHQIAPAPGIFPIVSLTVSLMTTRTALIN